MSGDLLFFSSKLDASSGRRSVSRRAITLLGVPGIAWHFIGCRSRGSPLLTYSTRHWIDRRSLTGGVYCMRVWVWGRRAGAGGFGAHGEAGGDGCGVRAARVGGAHAGDPAAYGGAEGGA